MPTPSIKQLEAFWWAATCANFATAAERLHLSVSSLSKRITELESVLGQALFDRSGHRAVLTESGQQLLPAALDVLNAVTAVGRALGSGTPLAGHCRFGVGDLSALTWLPSFVAAVRRLHPRLSLETNVDVGSALERRVADGELDFAVIAGRPARLALQAKPVGVAHFAWAARAGLIGKGRTGILALLQRHPLITLPAGAGTSRLLDDWLLAHEVTVQERILCNSWAAIAGMLCEGVGIGFLPVGWLAPLGLTAIRTQVPLTPLHYAVQWRRGDTRPFISGMQGLAREHVDFAIPPWVATGRSPTCATWGTGDHRRSRSAP